MSLKFHHGAAINYSHVLLNSDEAYHYLRGFQNDFYACTQIFSFATLPKVNPRYTAAFQVECPEMADAEFDWSLWRRCVKLGAGQVEYPHLHSQMQWLRHLNVDGFRPAAVMLLVQPEHEAQVVLTVRSLHLHQHSGQVSFAGGKQDPTDPDLVATALRETHEELGIAPHQIEVIGQMPPLPTVTAYQVHPVIGLLSPQASFHPNADEVARVFSVPLAQLMQPKRYESYPIQRENGVFQTVKFPHHEHIWGATATILLALAQCYQTFAQAHCHDLQQ